MANTISHLYIIGNGFDMHHGIDSSYFEYRMWLKDNYEDLYWKIVNLFYIDDESNESIVIVSAKRYHHSGVSGTIVSLKAVPL